MPFVTHFNELNKKQFAFFEISHFASTKKGKKIMSQGNQAFKDAFFTAVMNSGYVVKDGKGFVLVIPQGKMPAGDFYFSLHHLNGGILTNPCYGIKLEMHKGEPTATTALFYNERLGCYSYKSTLQNPVPYIDALRKKFVEIDSWHWKDTVCMGSRNKALDVMNINIKFKQGKMLVL